MQPLTDPDGIERSYIIDRQADVKESSMDCTMMKYNANVGRMSEYNNQHRKIKLV
jgi:hypothetical protein